MMRLTFCCLSLVAVLLLTCARARAQEPHRPLPIPIPNGAKVQFEMDAHQEDLLGMIKSFLSGLGGQKPGGAGKPPAGPASSGPGVLNASPATAFASILSDAQLTELLKDIRQLHVVVFALPPEGAAKGDAPAERMDLLTFYEEPFRAEGGRRLLWTDIGPQARALMIGFPQPRGFALVVQTPQMVVAVRTDGYLDLKAVGTLAAQFVGSEVLSSPGAPQKAPKSPPAVARPRPTATPRKPARQPGARSR